MGNDIQTNNGIPQGDCPSPMFFKLYLAEALKPILQTKNMEEHRNEANHTVTISQQYADDNSWITNVEESKENLKKEVPPALRKKNLQVNETKSEEYAIKKKWR